MQKIVNGFTAVQPGKLLYFSIAAQAGAQTPKELEFIQGKTRYTVESGAGLYPLDGVYPASSIGAGEAARVFRFCAPRFAWIGATPVPVTSSCVDVNQPA
ncbi:MAG: hypothetical protein HC933_22950 [Pleurocapsa sp. SU_196_0]|nr:hypothetical protein [Pleurocapsa sp. SU_196_0]